MKDSNSKRKFRPVFIMAAFVGLIFAGIMLATNLYIDDHGAENGEHDWMSSFLITQGIPFYFFFATVASRRAWHDFKCNYLEYFSIGCRWIGNLLISTNSWIRLAISSEGRSTQ